MTYDDNPFVECEECTYENNKGCVDCGEFVPHCQWVGCKNDALLRVTWMNNKSMCFCADHAVMHLQFDCHTIAWLRRVERL